MTDLEIANSYALLPISEIAKKLGLDPEIIEPYGRYKAKLPLHLIKKERSSQSNLILVSAISPTPAGEGKTTVSIGLSQGLNRIKRKSVVVLREPSLGPVFGIKGGATGGGYSQVVPMEDINLHFTGDFAAVEKAHNLLAALTANHIQHHRTPKGLDPRTVRLKRVMDMNDRSLRNIITGLGGKTSGVPRESGFDITAASEIMAILCLAENLSDLKRRLGNIYLGNSYLDKPIYARDLKAHGAMAALLKDAIKPNLVQTLEGTPAIIHGGPFANIAQGTNSVIATRMGLSLSDYVVTEAGFGFDLGAEKFFDIKCQYSGLAPKVVVLVATIRALKYHGGVPKDELTMPNAEAVFEGLPNLEKHIENIGKFNVPAIVVLNKFASDDEEEINLVRKFGLDKDISVHVADVWKEGGNGAVELAEEVVKTCEKRNADFKPLYDWDWSVPKKVETVAQEIYGASKIDFTPRAKADLLTIKKLGLDQLPVCIAKTQKSLSDNPRLLGRPKDFVVTVREIEIAAGAGFLIPITGDIMRMPGLPPSPAAERIDIDEQGNISGLF